MQIELIRFNSSNIYVLIQQPTGQLQGDDNKNSEQYKINEDKNNEWKQSIELN
jgi:hypothetical protein